MAQSRKKVDAGKVLVIDENPLELEATAAVFRDAGMRVLPLSRAEVAEPIYGAFQPDVMVLTVNAGTLRGLEVARRLSRRSKGTLPIVYLVAEPTPEAMQLCLERGAGLDAIAKPIDLSVLTRKVQGLVRWRAGLLRMAHAASELKTPTLRDPTTDVFNRRFLLAMIALETRRCERYGGAYSVVTCALKGFGQFKKELGRAMADRLLVYASVVLSQTVRESDVVARVGDNELAMLLPGTSAEQLPVFISRLAARFELSRFQVDGRTLRPEVAIGAASFPECIAPAPELLAEATRDQQRRATRREQLLVGAEPRVEI